MAEDIPDLFEGAALPQQVNGERMPQAMRPFEGNGKAAAPNPVIECVRDGRGAQWSFGCAGSEKYLPEGPVGPPMLEVVEEAGAHIVGQRQGKAASCFRLNQ